MNLTHTHNKRERNTLHKGTQVIKVRRNAKRKASDSQHKVDAQINWLSRNIFKSMEYDKYANKCADRHDRRVAYRKAKALAKQAHA